MRAITLCTAAGIGSAVVLAHGVARAAFDAAVLGWDGDKDAAIAHFDGSFETRDGNPRTVGFGIYASGTSVDWTNVGEWLPGYTTTFDKGALHVTITSFGDEVVISGNRYVVVYTRVAIRNGGSAPATGDPAPSVTDGLVKLASPAPEIAPAATANHDFAVAVDRFGGTYAWPTSADLSAAGSYDAHYAHMESYWRDRVASIVDIKELPDRRLIAAYKAGFVYTHIVKDGNDLNVGENGYDQVFDHDLLGILNTLFVIGDYKDAQTLLATTEKYVSPSRGYRDASWKFSWPWATYAQKTGDLDFVRAHFAAIKTRTHTIEADRTGPGGIMRTTDDIDAAGYWTTDDWAALFGLSTYRWLSEKLGETEEAKWATAQYDSLLDATNGALATTLEANGIGYLPCSPLAANDKNRCKNARDANWGAVFIVGNWAWDGFLFGARQSGPLIDLVDATYDYGFGRLMGALPAHTYGGYPGYSTAYNAGYGLSGLRGEKYRTEGILDYVFMIENGMNGPYSWWEGQQSPSPSPWKGNHPRSGGGSCPHMWGQSFATRALIDALLVEKSDGTVLLGRGVPLEWSGKPIQIESYPIAGKKRMGFSLTSTDTSVTVKLSGDAPSGNIRIELPVLKGAICRTTQGTFDRDAGFVEIAPTVRDVAITLSPEPCVDPPVEPPAPAPSTEKASGCGCHAGASKAGLAWVAALSLSTIFVRRRRR